MNEEPNKTRVVDLLFEFDAARRRVRRLTEDLDRAERETQDLEKRVLALVRKHGPIQYYDLVFCLDARREAVLVMEPKSVYRIEGDDEQEEEEDSEGNS